MNETLCETKRLTLTADSSLCDPKTQIQGQRREKNTFMSMLRASSRKMDRWILQMSNCTHH